MMAIERQGRSIAIYVFMASGRSNALRALECSAGARMLCGRSNALRALECSAGARMLCGRSNALRTIGS